MGWCFDPSILIKLVDDAKFPCASKTAFGANVLCCSTRASDLKVSGRVQSCARPFFGGAHDRCSLGANEEKFLKLCDRDIGLSE